MDHKKWVKVLTVVGYVLAVIGFLYYIEQVLLLPYVVKTLIKLPFFTIFPWLLLKYQLDVRVQLVLKKKDRVPMLLVCSVVVIAILGGLFLVRTWIDVSAISGDISTRMKVSPQLLLLAALYTTFINSFIEEFFFRGLLFLGLKGSGMKTIAYIASAFFFALYHVTIFMTWFTWPLMLLALFGLFVGGLIFAWFAHRTESLLGSWLIHTTADAAIMVIGLLLLDIGL